jgi:hypothetical protein
MNLTAPRPGGSPMNLTCTTQTGGGQNATATITIILNWPGGEMPQPPANSQTLVAPDPNVTYEVVGILPNGHPFPGSPYAINGANVAVYSTP